MSKTGGLTMQECERAKVVEAYSTGEIKAAVAAMRLGVSTRQARRLLERYNSSGPMGLISGRRSRPSNNRLPPGLAQRALEIIERHYADYGPTLACEQLRERHALVLSKETVRRLMIEAGLWTTRKAHQTSLHQPRERRACLGELVQIDGSRHHWFEQRGVACALLVYVDDATGRLLHLHFAETESTASYFDATARYIERHGKPRAFYADRAAVFRSPAANRREPTQFQRALDELGIELICANSPQAKGRVERINRTLQDRLVKALRMDGISSIAAANAWCGEFIANFNKRFERVARSELDLHTVHQNSDLALILAVRETRKLSSKLTVQHGTRQYLLDDQPALRALIGQSITIHTYADGRVELRANGAVLAYATLDLPKLGPVEVDSKTVHHVVDQLVDAKPPRKRHYRANQPATVVARGVHAAKHMSAQKRGRSL
jgi:transposase